jgi:hypothetical protein
VEGFFKFGNFEFLCVILFDIKRLGAVSPYTRLLYAISYFEDLLSVEIKEKTGLLVNRERRSYGVLSKEFLPHISCKVKKESATFTDKSLWFLLVRIK